MMRVPVVIVPPTQMVNAAAAKAAKVFASDVDDEYVDLLLSIAQSQIDGPDGWLGRAIGLQTLEVKMPAGGELDVTRLPLQPYIEGVSDVTVGGVRTVRYRAGYGASPAWPLPPAIKHAIILMAAALNDLLPGEEGALKSRTVDGVGRWDYVVTTNAAGAMQTAAAHLLQPYMDLRV